MRQSRRKLGRKIIPTGYVFIASSQLCESEFHLEIRSYLHDDIINSLNMILKYINKH